MYVKKVEAFCAEHQINLTKVDDNKKLWEWVGLRKTNREGKSWKVVGCSFVVVKDYGKESQAKDVIQKYFKCRKRTNKLCFCLKTNKKTQTSSVFKLYCSKIY